MSQTNIKAIETIYNGYRFRSRVEARWAVFFDTLNIKYEYEKEGFDLTGIPWWNPRTRKYEKYLGGYYLPDFWLPNLQRWIEIKGQKPTEKELEKAQILEAGTGYPVCLFYGLPGVQDGYAYFTCSHESNGGKSFLDDVVWSKCSMCRTIDVNIRHDDDCSLYSEIDGITLKYGCSCTIDDFKKYHRKRIYKGGPAGLRSKWQWQQYRNKSFEEYQEPTDEEFKEAIEVFIAELVCDLFPHGFIDRDKDYVTHQYDFYDAYTAARQARFEHGEKLR